MPNPLTHVLISIILIELFREYVIKNNRVFPRYYILVAAIGGIIPDLDYIAYYLLFPRGYGIEELHRTFLHSLFIPLIFVLIGLFILKINFKINWLRKRHVRLSVVFFILAFGSLIHIILDAIFSGVIMPFYPVSFWKIGLNIVVLFPEEIRSSISHLIDVILLFFWLFWMEFKLRISDYF